MEMIVEGQHVAQHELIRSQERAASAKAGEYLSYRLGSEEYGVDITRVQEIRSYEAPTRIPHASSYIKGVVNLRGVIVPIIDLRLKLGCDSAEITSFTVVIVLAVRGRVVGVIVDAVSDVLDLDEPAIKPPPNLSGEGDAEFVTGIASVGDRMLMLVDMNQLLDEQELSGLAEKG